MLWIAILSIILGLITLAYGTRLALLGAAVGVLLGLGILRLIPGEQESWLWLLIPIGLAILFSLGAGIGKRIIGLVTLAFGALAGGAIVLSMLDLFGLEWGVTNWILALVGAVLGMALASRFKKWTVIVLAGIVGALLCVRGLQIAWPSVDGFVASLIGLALAGASIAYQGGFLRSKDTKQG